MKKLLLMLIALVALASCEKKDTYEDVWLVSSPYGVVTVTGDGLPETKILKGGSQTFFKGSYKYIDVSCNNCAYKVNNKEYGVSTRFYQDGRELTM
jgi:hypothetical protein